MPLLNKGHVHAKPLHVFQSFPWFRLFWFYYKCWTTEARLWQPNMYCPYLHSGVYPAYLLFCIVGCCCALHFILRSVRQQADSNWQIDTHFHRSSYITLRAYSGIFVCFSAKNTMRIVQVTGVLACQQSANAKSIFFSWFSSLPSANGNGYLFRIFLLLLGFLEVYPRVSHPSNVKHLSCKPRHPHRWSARIVVC